MSLPLRSLYGVLAVVTLLALATVSASEAGPAERVAVSGPAAVTTPAERLPALTGAATAPPRGGADARPAATRPSEARTDRLPRTTPRTLPPMIRLHVPAGDPADRAALQRRVLGAGGLVLAPRARADVERGRVSTGTLRLLLGTAEVGGPLLVFEARGRTLRLQATTHVGTRRTMIVLHGLPAEQRPTIRLEPIPADFADAHTGPRETRSSGALGVQAARLATRYLGVAYVWGGASPAGVDCSGLTMLVYGELGIPLDHYAAFQFLEGARIAPGALRPGDLVFFNMKSDGPGHMGLYLGDDRFIHAPRRGDVVKISVLSERAGSYVGAVRPY